MKLIFDLNIKYLILDTYRKCTNFRTASLVNIHTKFMQSKELAC